MLKLIKLFTGKNVDFSSKMGSMAIFLLFVLVISFLLSSKFLSQDLLENGVGKKKIVAKKNNIDHLPLKKGDL